MNKYLILAAAAIMAATSLQAQTERSDDFRAKYELKEVVVCFRLF
jgi:glucose-1-phosphatase